MTWNRTILSGFRGYSPTDCRLFPSGLEQSLAPLHQRSQAGGGRVWVGQDKSINISSMKAPPAVSGSDTTAAAQPGRLPWLSHYKGITSTSCPHIRPGLSLDPTFMIHRAALFITALPLNIKPGSHVGDDFYSRVFTSRSFFKLLSILFGNMVETACHAGTKGCYGTDKQKESSFTVPSEAETARSDKIYTTVMLS